MDILDQLQEKVRTAVHKIEELQAKVNELEAIKQQYEEKMQSLVQEIGDIDSGSPESGSASGSETEQNTENRTQDSLYRHQY